MLGAEHLLPRWGLVLLDHAPCCILDAQDGHRRHSPSLVGQHRVGARHLQQRHVPTAQCQAQAIVGPVQRLDAHAVGHVEHGR